MKNESKGVAWLLPVIIVAIAVISVGAWAVLKEPSSSVTTNPDQTSQSGNNLSTDANVEARLEFPWSKYDASLTARASSSSTRLLGQTVTIGGSSNATTVIGKNIVVGGSSDITAVYAFDKLTLGAAGNIGKLYVESGTVLEIGSGATIGQKIVLSHNDLVRQAEAAAGISSQPTPPPATGTPSPAPTVAVYAGSWNGSHASSSLAGEACKSSGAVNLTVNSSGGVTGHAVVKGIQIPGTGKVDSNGNFSGSWNYAGTNLTYSGKLNNSANTGSGTWKDNFGCFGSFSVSR